MKKIVFFLITMIHVSYSYGLFFKDNREDVEYFKNLANGLQNKERFAQKSDHHFFRDQDLFVLLEQCSPDWRVYKGSPLHWKSACLIGIAELKDIIKELRATDPRDHRILDLLYLKQWAMSRRSLKDLKRYFN